MFISVDPKWDGLTTSYYNIKKYLTVFIVLVLTDTASAKMEPFIVGGEDVDILRYPHSAHLGIDYAADGDEVFICGSSIINQNILLTAAHCLIDCTNACEIIVTVGNANIDEGFVTRAQSYVIHQRFDSRKASHDIGLVKLKRQLQFNSNVRRVVLMSKPPYKEVAYVAGWGLVDELYFEESKTLKHAEQIVLSHKKCVKELGHMPVGSICASGKDGLGYASMGDSGSALVVRGYIEIGIVSHKLRAASRDLIVYTDVGYFYNWIKKTAKRLYCA